MQEVDTLLWNRKDLIETESLSSVELETIFQLARFFKNNEKSPEIEIYNLKNTSIVNLFMEPSTRTRVAFEMAAKRLGADVISIEGKSSSLTKGESLKDTALTLQALQANMLILRHSSPGSALYLSQKIDIPVINAGDGPHEHPTQALADAFTLLNAFNNNIQGIKVTILGDILFSRVARSNIWTLQKLGANITLAGPNSLVPKEFSDMGVTVTHDLKSAIKNADVIMTLRIQNERQGTQYFPAHGEYKKQFGLNQKSAPWIQQKTLLMHPGPINRGVEITTPLADSKNSLILEQVSNGIFVRMAVLYLCHRFASFNSN